MEDRKFIEHLLTTNADHLVAFVDQQNEFEFEKADGSKWSTGQTVEHLIRSLAPVNLALLLPAFLLRTLFGKPNREPRSYSGLVQRYHQKLAAGGRASGRFIPPRITNEQRSAKLKAFRKQVDTLKSRLKNWSEAELDHYLLPHPLLGKLTIREMLFFSVYHIEHHHTVLKNRNS